MSKRFISLLCIFAFLFTGIIGRCGIIAFGTAYKVADSYNSYTLNIGRRYTNFYDRTGLSMNNSHHSYVAVIRPNEKCLNELELLFDGREVTDIRNELSKGYPILRQVDRKADTKYIKIYEKISNENIIANHLLKREYGGLEQYVSEEIGSLSVNFSVDALGRILAGDEGTLINNQYDNNDGIIISLDSKLQKIAEEASKTIPKGAVVIMDSDTSQVLASVSRGDDYINRALSPYAVGSVFKLIICASALENNITPIYNCTSKITVGDTEFNCQKKHKHGMQNMKQALANSCNCYFVNLALKLGADKIRKTAEDFGFCKEFSLYKKWNVKAFNFPNESELNSQGQLALLGFGQGMLTDNPMHFTAAVSCIANGGNYHAPTLSVNHASDNRIISEKTADIIREYMRYVVESGTGSPADYNSNSAGKTATAQSGIYSNGTEVLNTWFAGFYPYNNPEYAIVIMRENGVSGAGDCCPVFRTIVEKIEKMRYNN